MSERLSRFGVGPYIVGATIAYALLAGIATLAWPNTLLLRVLDHPVIAIIAVILIVLGLPLWLIGIVTVQRAYNHDQLVTSGVFALVRHPMYSAWIVLILPGLVLLSRSWPLLVTPIVTYIVFKTLIRKEDDYLTARYGKPYLEYRARVREIVPIPRF